MTKTKEWAESLGINTKDVLPPAEDHDEPHKRTAGEVAVRAVILHAVAAVGYGAAPEQIVDWLKDQHVWDSVSPIEQDFLLSTKPWKLREDERIGARWLQEALWALLWTIQKVEGLGLPTKICDADRLVNEIMPELGDDIEAFVSSAELRPASEVRAEGERVSSLHSHALKASREDAMPNDLIYGVLYQRQHAFAWLSSEDDWDDVKTAA